MVDPRSVHDPGQMLKIHIFIPAEGGRDEASLDGRLLTLVVNATSPSSTTMETDVNVL